MAVIGGGMVIGYVCWEAGSIKADIKQINSKVDKLTGLIHGVLGTDGKKNQLADALGIFHSSKFVFLLTIETMT